MGFLCTVPNGPPLNFTTNEVLLRSFTLVWDLPPPSERNGIITGYNISITSLNSLFAAPQLFFTTSLSINVDSLDPHTNYICIIAANTAIGIGPFSLEIIVMTGQDGMHFMICSMQYVTYSFTVQFLVVLPAIQQEWL